MSELSADHFHLIVVFFLTFSFFGEKKSSPTLIVLGLGVLAAPAVAAKPGRATASTPRTARRGRIMS